MIPNSCCCRRTGTSIGVLYAPKSGAETREDLKASALEAKERAAKRAEPPPPPEPDPDDVRGAAEAVAEAALTAAEKARPPVRRLPLAPPPRPADDDE